MMSFVVGRIEYSGNERGRLQGYLVSVVASNSNKADLLGIQPAIHCTNEKRNLVYIDIFKMLVLSYVD